MRIRRMFTLSVVAISMFLLIPTTTDTRTIPKTFKYDNLDKHSKRQIECLTDNIFFEAVGESHKGKIAVAFVTMNRVASGLYPNDVCEVVKQKTGKTCQFSWVCQKKTTARKHLTLDQESLYNYIRSIAMSVYMQYRRLDDPSRGALFYHADYVNPRWKNVEKTTKIGKHIFYRLR